MNVVITSEILKAYYLCPRKAYLLLYSKEQGNLHEYEKILLKNQLESQSKYLELLQKKYIDISPYSFSNFQEKHEFLTNAKLVVDGLQAKCAVLARTRKLNYEPTIIIGTHTINHTDKLDLMFVGHVLAKILDKPADVGHIVNVRGESRRFKLEGSHKVVIPLLECLQDWLNESCPEEPPVILNKHCPTCQFREQCRAKAIQEDSLSLLDKVTPKIIRQYEKKGIFTVKQLSYLFKPRKRKKRARKPPAVTHDLKLQALAIRTGKIYLQEIPTLIRQETELYLDIEGLPDQNLYYLIGLLVRQGERIEYHPIWADDIQNERKIWQEFLTIVSQYPNTPIYHYGSYELRAIKTLEQRYESNNQEVIARLVNINKQIYAKVYFPVYSNKLKELASFIGATWTAPDASGIQSLVWRHYWNDSHDHQYKLKLITYNQEDCHALKLLVDELEKIKYSADVLSDVDFSQTPKSQISEAGEKVRSQFEMILRFASVKYEKRKISFSQGQVSEGGKRGGTKPSKTMPKPNKFVQVPQVDACFQCGYTPLKLMETRTSRTIIDLVLAKNGVKKVVTKYFGFHGYCVKCQRNYPPPKLLEFEKHQFYGHGFKSWIVYQRVALRLPLQSILESAKEQFNEQMSSTRISYFMKNFAEYYAETEHTIMKRLLESPFIHVDETNFSIKGVNWYVWVFTNGDYVLFKLTETRETTIVHQILEKYEGVLISDFYTGYDSIPCKHQKCWVHLIRNLNKDLRENPFDIEYEAFILEIRNLIIPIMETVQKNGLKKAYLHKFSKLISCTKRRYP